MGQVSMWKPQSLFLRQWKNSIAFLAKKSYHGPVNKTFEKQGSNHGKSSQSPYEPNWFEKLNAFVKRMYQQWDDFSKWNMPYFVQSPGAVNLILVSNLFVYSISTFFPNYFNETLRKWFVCNPDSGVTSAFLCTFAHADLIHLLVNMGFLLAFGPGACGVLGPLRFLFLYSAGGIAASFAETRISKNAACGASGSLCTLMGFYFLRQKNVYVSLLGIVPTSWKMVIGLFCIFESWRVILQFSTDSFDGGGSIAHLTGVGTGLALAFLL